jgi:Leucine-rich repeat (LRR) protein
VAIEDINLSQNKFFGSPLDVFSNCINLKRLNLSNNLFDKELNISLISGLNSLELLYLQNNSIKGEIENQISCLVSLRFFNLSNNQIKGKLPPNFGELRKLETCILSNNQIIGPIPKSLSEICNLKDFHIFNQWPSESMSLPREFKSLTYRRLYKDALLLRFDSLSWDEHQRLKTVSSSHNINNGKNNVDIKKKKKKKNEKNVQK